MALSRKPQEIVEDSKNPLLAKHESWERVSVGDIADILNGFAFKSSKFTNDKGMPLIRIRDVGKDSSETFYNGEYDKTYLVNDGDLLVGMDGDFRAAIWKGGKALLNQRVCKISLKTDEYDFKFLSYALQPYLDAIHAETSAVTVKHLSSRSISEIPLPLPPKEQQKRIVAKIEELFSHIDAGIEALKKAKQLLKQYHQSVLKAAVTGELTKEWREANKDKLESASQLLERILKERRQKWEEQQLKQFKAKGKMPKDDKWKEKYKEPSYDIDKFFEVPEGWAWAEIGTITDMLSGHAFKKAEYTDSGVRLFQIANVSFGYTKWEEIEYLPENYLEEWKHLKLEEGDVLMALNRPLLSKQLKITRLGKSDVPSILYQRVGKFQFYSDIMSDYFLLYMQSPYYINRLEEQLQGVNIPFINKGNLLETPISIPSCEDEVKMIIDEANRQLDRIERLNIEIDKQLIKAGKNKQTILSAAFAGKLVENSESNTDVKLLLDNIKTRTAIKKKHKSDAKPNRKSASSKKNKQGLIDIIYESFGLNKFSIDELLGVTEIDDFSTLKLELFELLKNPIGKKYLLDMQFDEKDEKYIFCLIQRSLS